MLCEGSHYRTSSLIAHTFKFVLTVLTPPPWSTCPTYRLSAIIWAIAVWNPLPGPWYSLKSIALSVGTTILMWQFEYLTFFFVKIRITWSGKMTMLMLEIRSMALMNVILLWQKELLKGTKSSESLASPGLLITCQLTGPVVKEKWKSIYKCWEYIVWFCD